MRAGRKVRGSVRRWNRAPSLVPNVLPGGANRGARRIGKVPATGRATNGIESAGVMS